MNDANGQPLCLGSGFFVSKDIIATNAHVIAGAGSGSAKLVGQKQIFQIVGTVAVDRHADLALLRVSGTAPSLGLSHGSAPSIGDDVFVVGNPLGLEGTFSEGIISGVRTIGTDSLLQMTAPISPGSSGGPVMDAAGYVIGISVATYRQGQNLNLAVPVEYLDRMIRSETGSVVPLISNSNLSGASVSFIDGLGARTEEGVTASDFRLGESRSYHIRLSNKLPIAASHISVVVIFYDKKGKMLDFDHLEYKESIPAGLTKDAYQDFFMDDQIKNETWSHGHPTFKTELRVIGFETGSSAY